ncbi:MAG: hypothetical protein ACXVCP_11125 [Bdellovibrio sp.]
MNIQKIVQSSSVKAIECSKMEARKYFEYSRKRYAEDQQVHSQYLDLFGSSEFINEKI